jgi:hypothetical protein
MPRLDERDFDCNLVIWASVQCNFVSGCDDNPLLQEDNPCRGEAFVGHPASLGNMQPVGRPDWPLIFYNRFSFAQDPPIFTSHALAGVILTSALACQRLFFVPECL